jgi:hypothetical protein
MEWTPGGHFRRRLGSEATVDFAIFKTRFWVFVAETSLARRGSS